MQFINMKNQHLTPISMEKFHIDQKSLDFELVYESD